MTPQHLQALDEANRLRIHRARVKEQIKRGEMTVLEALDDPLVARAPKPSKHTRRGMTIGELLRAQQRWGVHRVHRFLSPLDISENRPICRLTERQRGQLERALG